MRYRIENGFHNSSIDVSVKNLYCREGESEVLAALEYAVYAGEDAGYAKRKLREIKDGVCGSGDCTCGVFNEAYEI